MPDLWKWTLASGVLAVILGICVLVWPGISILVAAILFGVYLLITGIAQVIFAFALDVSAGSRILLFISGAASLILAVLAFRHFGKDQTTAVLLLAIWIGVGWLIFYGVITLIAGFVVMAWPFDSIVVLAITTGVWLVIMGVFEIVSAFGIRKDATKIADFGQEIRQEIRGQTAKDSKGAARAPPTR